MEKLDILKALANAKEFSKIDLLSLFKRLKDDFVKVDEAIKNSSYDKIKVNQ